MKEYQSPNFIDNNPFYESPLKTRIQAIDLARGIAVSLMILSHGVKGLLSFDQFTSWGIVPLHLITKFSSTLFILVFGISLAVAYLPYVETEKWPQKRMKLLLRGFVILFWYKILTIIEMFSQYSREQVLDTLMYKAFPSYVEILGFYGLALLWLPWFLGLWKSLPLWARFLLPILCAIATPVLRQISVFGENEIFEALVIEHQGHYTWGQLARAPLIFTGLLMGEWLLKNYSYMKKRLLAFFVLLCAALAFGGYFYHISSSDLASTFQSIALNEGKHPPELNFMLFSIFGALLLLSFCLLGGERLATWLKPFTIIGQDALQAFIFHIFVIFVFYRHLLDYWLKIPYEKALQLTVVLIVATALWVRIRVWVLKKSS